MPSLFENAVASIRMGIEDFRQQDGDRAVSAVRNFYAGVLLLAKETLIRAAPSADPGEVIGTQYKPIPDGHGGVTYEQVGHKTVDFTTVAQRFKDFHLTIDHAALADLNRIRNDMEHHYTDKPEAAIRTAIAKGFPVAASLFRQMDEDPRILLGETWQTMLQAREFYDLELRAAKDTLKSVQWHSGIIASVSLKCPDCDSELLEQTDSDNNSQSRVVLRCRNCGATPSLPDLIETTLDQLYSFDAYARAKEGDTDGPIYDCPGCNRTCLLEFENDCANCGEAIEYKSECIRCSNGISLQDYLDGLDDGLCSYCNYVSDKVMRE